MPEAARVTDATHHPGVLAPVGHPTVLINGLASCTMGDMHKCTLHPPCNPINEGSTTVQIGGLAAARRGDSCQCGALITLPCSPNVLIGGAGATYTQLLSQNCYGYASGTNTFRQPGGARLSVPHDLNVAAVKGKLIADLGPPMPDPSAAAPLGFHKIAFYTYPDVDPTSGVISWDFHVYRQDRDGYWSHKPGHTEIRRFDNACAPITDPAKANRGSYSEYVGTWVVKD